MKTKNKSLEGYKRWALGEMYRLQRGVAGRDGKIKNLEGEVVVSWASHFYTQIASSVILGNLKAGDEIAIIGVVVETETNSNQDGKARSSAKIEIKQTRKVDGFLSAQAIKP